MLCFPLRFTNLACLMWSNPCDALISINLHSKILWVFPYHYLTDFHALQVFCGDLLERICHSECALYRLVGQQLSNFVGPVGLWSLFLLYYFLLKWIRHGLNLYSLIIHFWLLWISFKKNEWHLHCGRCINVTSDVCTTSKQQPSKAVLYN